MSSFDIIIAARTCWMEARSEPDIGWQGVAWVILNRYRAKKWYSGKTIAETCLMDYQFSCWNNSKDINRELMSRLPETDPLLVKMTAYFSDIVKGIKTADPTNGATHYYAPAVVKEPAWVKGSTACGKLGAHLFFKGVA